MELSPTEQEAARELTHRGFAYTTAMIIVIMAVRTAGRSRPQLIDTVLAGYPGLEDQQATGKAVGELLQDGWLEEADRYGTLICQASPSIFARLEQLIGTDLASRLQRARALK